MFITKIRGRQILTCYGDTSFRDRDLAQAACAVREAYAAKVSVVILVERGGVDVEVEKVDRLVDNL